jgi:hypothetical protein
VGIKRRARYQSFIQEAESTVYQSTTNILSAQNILSRNTALSLNANKLKTIKDEEIDQLLNDPSVTLAL